MLVQEKADEYTKISESQKKTINNCFLAKSMVAGAKGNSGSEKAILVRNLVCFGKRVSSYTVVNSSRILSFRHFDFCGFLCRLLICVASEERVPKQLKQLSAVKIVH